MEVLTSYSRSNLYNHLDTIMIAVGAGAGGFVVIGLITLVVCMKVRNVSTKSSDEVLVVEICIYHKLIIFIHVMGFL